MSSKKPKPFERAQLGEGVHVCFDGDGYDIFTRPNAAGGPVYDEIYLSKEAVDQLVEFVEQMRARELK